MNIAFQRQQSTMRFTDHVASLVLLGATTVSAFGRHAAHKGLLQIPPAFAREGINLYPALHPEHNHASLDHLVPEVSKRMHYSQEGHRPALHGAKHAHLEATFSHPTVVLEHSSHVEDVKCTKDQIKVCFNTPEALNTVKKAWKKEITSEEFNLVTYHINCGHLTGERRSFFRASRPNFAGDCVTVAINFVDETDAVHAGELSWGTYTIPHLTKRQPVKGHVRASKPDDVVVDGAGGNETVDLTKDADAIHAFFGPNVHFDTDIPDEKTEGGGFLDYEGDLARRGLFSWVINALRSLVNFIQARVEQNIAIVLAAAKAVVAYAATAVNLFLVPFGVPFDQEYHADISFKHYLSPAIGIGTDLASTIGGAADGLGLSDEVEAVYNKQGGSIFINCAECGTKGDLTFDGKLAFSISDGLSKAQISLINNKPFVIEAIFGLTAQGRGLPTGKEVTDSKGKKKTKGVRTTVSKEFPALPLTPLYIPGVLTIGPQVVLEPAASVYFDTKAKIRTGPRFTVSPGNLTLDAKNPEQNVAEGWEPKFDWVFDIDGNVVATADLALQVGVEVALDVLTGTYKTSAGIYTAPSVYFTAEYSHNQGRSCDNGIELRLGAKNRVYSSVFGLREWEFKELGTTFADKGLGCIGPDGSWDTSKVGETKFLEGYAFNNGVAKEVKDLFNNTLASEKNLTVAKPERIELGEQHAEALKYKNAQGEVQKMPQTSGFRVIQDANQTGTLVSGNDGRIYMADNSGDYDLSAPWGALDLTKEQYDYDVFGRLVYFNATRYNNHGYGVRNLMLEMGVAPSEKTPKGVADASFKAIKTENEVESFGLALNGSSVSSHQDQWFWYPTVCQVPTGLQLFASGYIVNEDGSATFGGEKRSHFASQIYHKDLSDLGLKGISDSDLKKLSKLLGKYEGDDEFNDIGDDGESYRRQSLTEMVRKWREHVHNESDLKKLLDRYGVEPTDANVKTLAEILGCEITNGKFKTPFQICRSVRLISDLKNGGGSGGVVSDVVKGLPTL